MTIPILKNHDHRDIVGACEIVDGELIVSVKSGIYKGAMLNVFGNVSFIPLEFKEVDGVIIIYKFKLLSWSL